MNVGSDASVNYNYVFKEVIPPDEMNEMNAQILTATDEDILRLVQDSE